MSSYHGQASKSRTKVKPILRKLTQSEKNSLDLDRPASEQDGLGIYDYGTGSRSTHDVAAGRRGYHNRSTSGTSQFSTATSASGHRTGSFVHPFQQMPRPYTPPLAQSYQNSLRESDSGNSPALTDDEDPTRRTAFRSTSNLSNRTPSLTSATSPTITTNAQSQLLPQLRIQTKQPSSSRLNLSTSHTSIHNLNPLSPDLGNSPIETAMSPTASALRTSTDKGFRLRSRSDADTHTRDRALTIQEARRQFAERERVKEEKAAREEIRALEKRNQKEALRIERGHRRSSASGESRSKRSKSDLTVRSEKIGQGGEAGLFAQHSYSSALGPGSGLPFSPETDEDGEDDLEGPRRARSYSAGEKAKKKTHSAWTKLMMWIRTRFLRMKSKKAEPVPETYYAAAPRPTF
jgi:hypothetical protein